MILQNYNYDYSRWLTVHNHAQYPHRGNFQYGFPAFWEQLRRYREPQTVECNSSSKAAGWDQQRTSVENPSTWESAPVEAETSPNHLQMSGKTSPKAPRVWAQTRGQWKGPLHLLKAPQLQDPECLSQPLYCTANIYCDCTPVSISVATTADLQNHMQCSYDITIGSLNWRLYLLL